MTATTRLYSFFCGALVGKDAFGNRYYRQKRVKPGAREKRWVIYKGMAEPSKVPAEWHGWLHHTHDIPPVKRTLARQKWEKPHLPNLTGTPGSYAPQGHLQKSGTHAPTTAQYEAWKP